MLDFFQLMQKLFGRFMFRKVGNFMHKIFGSFTKIFLKIYRNNSQNSTKIFLKTHFFFSFRTHLYVKITLKFCTFIFFNFQYGHIFVTTKNSNLSIQLLYGHVASVCSVLHDYL